MGNGLFGIKMAYKPLVRDDFRHMVSHTRENVEIPPEGNIFVHRPLESVSEQTTTPPPPQIR